MALKTNGKPCWICSNAVVWVEVETAQSVEGGFSQTDTSQKQQELEQASALLEQAVALLDQYAPSKKGFLSFLAGRTPHFPGRI